MRHPEDGLAWRLLRRAIAADEHDRSPLWCVCDDPVWESCGPIFPAARQCATCGRPAAEDLGIGDRR